MGPLPKCRPTSLLPPCTPLLLLPHHRLLLLPRRRWSSSAACNPTWSRERDGALAGPPLRAHNGDDAIFIFIFFYARLAPESSVKKHEPQDLKRKGGAREETDRVPCVSVCVCMCVSVCVRVCYWGSGERRGGEVEEQCWIRLPSCLRAL